MAKGTAYHHDAHKEEVIKQISANKLIEGGAAILQALKTNHQNVRDGKILMIPLVKNNLRVFVLSYVILARENRHEEHKPCETINVNAPHQPQAEFRVTPMITRAMCPTDEYAINDLMSV